MPESLISSVLLQKSSPLVWTISANATVGEAAATMTKRNIGALVVEDSGRIAGLITEREYVGRVVAKRVDPDTTLVREVMEKTLIGVSPETTVEQCFAIMTEYRVRYIGVVEFHALVGFISIGDIVRSVIEDREFELKELEKYLNGPYCAWNVPISVSWTPGQIQVLRCSKTFVRSAPFLDAEHEKLIMNG